MKVIILAGGKGTRLHRSAKDMPKALVPVAGKPILEHQLDLLKQYGFNDIRLSLGFKADQIIEYLGGKYEYLIEPEPLGTGGALKFACRDLNEPFIAMNGDIITDINLANFANRYKKGMNCLAVSFCRQNTDFGFLQIGRNGAIKQFLEKPKKPKNGFVSVGFYILEPDAIRSITQKSFSLEYDLFPHLAQEKKLNSFEHKGFWIDVGTEKRLHFMRSAPENEKITLFTVPRGFVGKDAMLQKNAIESWNRLSDNVEILLMGNAEEVKEYAATLPKAKHIPEIAVNKFGTALLGDVFKKAIDTAAYEMMAFVQSDIILTANFITSVRSLPRRRQFLAVARQTDIAIDAPIDFSGDWEEKLEKEIVLHGAPRGLSAMNVMIFPKNMHIPQSNLLIGKPGWDNAFAYHIMQNGVPMIDASLAFTPIYQKHEESRANPEESQRNFELAGGFSQMVSIRNAHILFTRHGLEKPTRHHKIYSALLLWYPVRKIIGVKRWIQRSYKMSCTKQ